MARYTVLSPGGYSRPPWASFDKSGGGRVYTQTFTVLSPGGFSRPFAGSFSGKPVPTSQFFEWIIRARRRGRR